MVLSLSMGVPVPYAARVQLYPPEDEHLRLEKCRGKYYLMNKCNEFNVMSANPATITKIW